MGNEPSGPNPVELSRSGMAELRTLVNQGWEYFWSRDETRGYDKSGKRIGTGIPRQRNDHSAFGGRKVPSSKSKKSNECTSGRP